MRGLRTAVYWGVFAVLAGCNHDNPGFKLKGSDDGAGASETGVSVSGASGTSVSGVPTTGEPPDTTAGPGTSNSTTTGVTESSGGEVGSVGTTGEPLTNDCMVPATIELTSVKDTFLVDRSWADGAPCALLDQVAPEGNWVQGITYCRDRNFGSVSALPLIDMPQGGGRDVIHYLLQFDMKPLLDVNTQKPVQFAQITSADLVLTVERLGEAAIVGAYPVSADQPWVAGTQSGEQALEGQVTYRCRQAPAAADPVKPCGVAAGWQFGVPIPEGGFPTREASTELLMKGMVSPLVISFMPSDFFEGLEGFFGVSGHHGFLVGLPPVDPASTADKVKVYADEAAETDEGDIRLAVHYCPAPP